MIGNIYIVGGSDWRMTDVATNATPDIFTFNDVGIGTDNPNSLGKLSVVVPTTGGAGAINVQNHAQGSGLSNIVLRSLDNNGGNWAEAEFRAEGYSFKNRTTERFSITSGGHIRIPEATNTAGKLQLGASQQLSIFQDSANAYLANDDFIISNGAVTEVLARFRNGGAVDLNYDNSKKFETTNTGVSVTGNIAITNGNGIDFSATSDASGMSSELLDDYEEGTFTPTVSVEGQSNATTDKQYGRYIKVGNKVTVWCYVQLNGTPSGRGVNNAWQHGGLPFSQRNTAGGFDIAGSILYWTIDSTSALNGTPPYHLVPRLFNNATGGRIRAHDSSSSQSGQNASLLLKDNTEYTYTFTYEVA
jgi:hypothetical protein